MRGLHLANISRFLALEGDCRHVFDLIAAQKGTALTPPLAYEEERRRAEGPSSSS